MDSANRREIDSPTTGRFYAMDDAKSGTTNLLDEDGEIFVRLPGFDWSFDNLVGAAYAYQVGRQTGERVGRAEAQREIQRAIGIIPRG